MLEHREDLGGATAIECFARRACLDPSARHERSSQPPCELLPIASMCHSQVQAGSQSAASSKSRACRTIVMLVRAARDRSSLTVDRIKSCRACIQPSSHARGERERDRVASAIAIGIGMSCSLEVLHAPNHPCRPRHSSSSHSRPAKPSSKQHRDDVQCRIKRCVVSVIMWVCAISSSWLDAHPRVSPCRSLAARLPLTCCCYCCEWAYVRRPAVGGVGTGTCVCVCVCRTATRRAGRHERSDRMTRRRRLRHQKASAAECLLLPKDQQGRGSWFSQSSERSRLE